MHKHKRTGHLHADLPSGVPSLRGPCNIDITLEAGNMVSCSITNSRSNSLLTGDRAYQELTRVGRIHWTFVPMAPPATHPGLIKHAVEQKTISRPRRTIIVEQWQMVSWQRPHKLVYGLADGTRSISEIADLLTTTPEIIETILRDLQAIHVITME